MNEKEGFSIVHKEDGIQQKTYRNEKIYDNFYTYIYDDVVLSMPYLIEMIEKISPYLQNNSHTLCIGSKTGHLVQLLSKTTRVTGLESSKSMVKMSQYKYPENEFVHGYYLDSSLFQPNKFSHVILPMLTIHTMSNFKEFCFVVKEWTVHTGFFFVTFADLRKLPVYKLVNHYPSSYFNSNYQYSIEFKDNKMIETITDTNRVERTNEQEMYEYTESSIINLARPSGFIHVKTLQYEKIPLSICIFQHK
jgi:hypothetical protein